MIDAARDLLTTYHRRCRMQTHIPGAASNVPLEAIVLTEQLGLRNSRAPDIEGEKDALLELARLLANEPRTILQRLAQIALRLCDADSAGISIQESENGQAIFRWHAVAGQLGAHLGGTTPRYFSPCGTVLIGTRCSS